MATNYTFAQVVNAFYDANDVNLMVELGRRYPLLVAKINKMIALAGAEFVAFANAMPEHMTANKLNRAMLESTAGTADAEDEATENEADDEAEDSDSADLATKTTKELYAMCIKKGLKVSKYGKPKSYYIDALNGAGESDGDGDAEQVEEKPAKKAIEKTTKKVASKVEEDEDGDSEDDDAENPYEGKTAIELFNECKKRGVKAVPKKPAKYYVDLLTKADAAAAEDDDADDDWGDEEPEEKPAKKAKATKKAKEDEADDDDWDI